MLCVVKYEGNAIPYVTLLLLNDKEARTDFCVVTRNLPGAALWPFDCPFPVLTTEGRGSHNYWAVGPLK